MTATALRTTKDNSSDTSEMDPKALAILKSIRQEFIHSTCDHSAHYNHSAIAHNDDRLYSLGPYLKPGFNFAKAIEIVEQRTISKRLTEKLVAIAARLKYTTKEELALVGPQILKKFLDQLQRKQNPVYLKAASDYLGITALALEIVERGDFKSYKAIMNMEEAKDLDMPTIFDKLAGKYIVCREELPAYSTMFDFTMQLPGFSLANCDVSSLLDFYIHTQDKENILSLQNAPGFSEAVINSVRLGRSYVIALENLAPEKHKELKEMVFAIPGFDPGQATFGMAKAMRHEYDGNLTNLNTHQRVANDNAIARNDRIFQAMRPHLVTGFDFARATQLTEEVTYGKRFSIEFTRIAGDLKSNVFSTKPTGPSAEARPF